MWWLFSAFVLASGGGMLGAFHWESKRLRALRDIVELCGLRVVSISRPAALRSKITASAGPVAARIKGSRKRDYGIQVMVTFPGPPGFSGVRIRRETFRLPGAREIEVGDPAFDSRFYVEGPSRLLSVLLDAETRRLLAEVNTCGQLEIYRGELRVETFDPHLASVLSLLLEIARRFAETGNVAERLAGNARHDPQPGVRLRNLLILSREFPGEAGTVEVLRSACADPSPQIRLRAAMELGAEGYPVLVELAESLENDACSAQAIVRLGRELPFERVRTLLAQTLRSRRIPQARACLEVLGTSGEPEALDVLEKVLAIEKGELAAVAALALGATGSAAAEPPLLPALRRERADIRVAAANALARVGTAAAVLPLKEAAEGATDDPELRRATRQAIAEIQSRLQGASPGQLSLAGAEAGQLSLPQAEAGQLSLATDAAGQLSLPAGEAGPPPA
jgi:HEAT repeat protein